MSSVDGSGEDRISDLPDKLLHSILLLLPSASDAARTSLLSRRWSRVWTGLPELSFSWSADDPSPCADAVDAVLAAHASPVLHHLAISIYNP
uniref:F-box domain-containing protein n=1 Tax=Oryza punctata TaxID=4537 RepID=A0A0E0LM02_ORYPU